MHQQQCRGSTGRDPVQSSSARQHGYRRRYTCIIQQAAVWNRGVKAESQGQKHRGRSTGAETQRQKHRGRSTAATRAEQSVRAEWKTVASRCNSAQAAQQGQHRGSPKRRKHREANKTKRRKEAHPIQTAEYRCLSCASVAKGTAHLRKCAAGWYRPSSSGFCSTCNMRRASLVSPTHDA